MCRSFQVVELSAARSPEKCKNKSATQYERHGNHENQNAHRVPRTEENKIKRELIGIRIAAVIGLM